MKKILALGFALTLCLSCFSQSQDKWEKWQFLLGEWVGEGDGQPGKGSGGFSFTLDLDGKVLVRKSQTDFPSQGDKQPLSHKDLMVIYPDSSNDLLKACYFDNEGHVISYSVTFSNGDIVFTSIKEAGKPVFRLIYSPISSREVEVKFEMSADGVLFKTYVKGKSIRK